MIRSATFMKFIYQIGVSSSCGPSMNNRNSKIFPKISDNFKPKCLSNLLSHMIICVSRKEHGSFILTNAMARSQTKSI